MMPGSTIGGRSYTRANNAPIAFAPAWIVEQCKNAKPKSSAAGKRIVEEDDIAIELFTNWILKRAPHAGTGKIDDTTYKVATKGYDFGCSQATVYELMLGWNETHCDPPGDIERLAVVVDSAEHNRENAIGCSHPLAPGFKPVEIDESKAPQTVVGIPTAKIGDAGAWENEPNAIFVDHLKPADLPTGVLPELVEQFARDRACRLGVDAGAPAAALVTALGSLVPAGNRLQMRQLDTEWTVKPILWTAIIGPPGSNKSATINAAMGPVQKLQSAWRKSFAADEHKRKADETRRASAAKAKQESTDEVFEGEAKAGKPRFRQKIYNDATTEALAVALCENPEGLLYHADELAGWLAGMDAYRAKGGKDRAFWLQAKEGGDFTVKGRDKRPGLDAMMKAVNAKEFDMVAAWSVDRLGRSLTDLLAILQALRDKGVDLFLHQQGLDTSTTAGRAMFQMLGVFAEFERGIIRERVNAGLARAREKGTRLGRPPTPVAVEKRIRSLRAKGMGVLKIGRTLGVGTSVVQRVVDAM